MQLGEHFIGIADAMNTLGGSGLWSEDDGPWNRTLVETQLAAYAGSSYRPARDPYLFDLDATVQEGHRANEIEAALLRERLAGAQVKIGRRPRGNRA